MKITLFRFYLPIILFSFLLPASGFAHKRLRGEGLEISLEGLQRKFAKISKKTSGRTRIKNLFRICSGEKWKVTHGTHSCSMWITHKYERVELDLKVKHGSFTLHLREFQSQSPSAYDKGHIILSVKKTVDSSTFYETFFNQGRGKLATFTVEDYDQFRELILSALPAGVHRVNSSSTDLVDDAELEQESSGTKRAKVAFSDLEDQEMPNEGGDLAAPPQMIFSTLPLDYTQAGAIQTVATQPEVSHCFDSSLSGSNLPGLSDLRPLAQSEAPVPMDLAPDFIDVEVLQFEALVAMLKTRGWYKENPSFAKLLADLVRPLTWFPTSADTGNWTAWLERAGKKAVRLVIEKQPFISELSTEAELARFSGRASTGYYVIALYEEAGEGLAGESLKDKLLMYMRFDEEGLIGELIQIEKGESFSGSDLVRLSDEFRTYFAPAAFLVFDDAKITFQVPNRKTETKFLIRPFSVLASDGEGATWYQKVGGYTPLNLKHLTRTAPLHSMNAQNDRVYFAAVKKLRNLKLYTFFNSILIQEGTARRRAALEKVIRNYYGPELLAENGTFDQVIKTKEWTLHELAKKIDLDVRTQTSQAIGNFALFYDALLSFESLLSLKSLSPQLRSYVLAVRTIRLHNAWIKTQGSPMQWTETTAPKLGFDQITPDTFDRLVAPLDPRIQTWEEAAPLLLNF